MQNETLPLPQSANATGVTSVSGGGALNEDIVVTKSCYDDFSQPCPWRTFEVIVEDKILYVNAGWLAELSPFFAEFAFGDHDEPRNAFIVDDLLYHEVLEFFRCVFYCPMRKPLTVANVSLVLRVATRLEMRPVVARCEQFVARTAGTLDRNRLFQVTCAMSQCDPNSTTMSVLVDRLANMKEDELSRLQFSQMPGDVVADVYAQKIRRRERSQKKKLCTIM